MARCACASEVYGSVFVCLCAGPQTAGGAVAAPWHSRSNNVQAGAVLMPLGMFCFTQKVLECQRSTSDVDVDSYIALDIIGAASGMQELCSSFLTRVAKNSQRFSARLTHNLNANFVRADDAFRKGSEETAIAFSNYNQNKALVCLSKSKRTWLEAYRSLTVEELVLQLENQI